jgi:hypothetical protein
MIVLARADDGDLRGTDASDDAEAVMMVLAVQV